MDHTLWSKAHYEHGHYELLECPWFIKEVLKKTKTSHMEAPTGKVQQKKSNQPLQGRKGLPKIIK